MKINQCITFSRRFIHFNKTAMYRVVVGGLLGMNSKKKFVLHMKFFISFLTFLSNVYMNSKKSCCTQWVVVSKLSISRRFCTRMIILEFF